MSVNRRLSRNFARYLPMAFSRVPLFSHLPWPPALVLLSRVSHCVTLLAPFWWPILMYRLVDWHCLGLAQPLETKRLVFHNLSSHHGSRSVLTDRSFYCSFDRTFFWNWKMLHFNILKFLSVLMRALACLGAPEHVRVLSIKFCFRNHCSGFIFILATLFFNLLMHNGILVSYTLPSNLFVEEFWYSVGGFARASS